MAAVGVEEDPAAVQAARILLGLRKVSLFRWPERVQKDSAAAEAVEVEAPWPPERWPKGPRSRRRLHGDWTAALPIPKLAAVGVSAGSGACSSGGEEQEQDQRWRDRRSVRYEAPAAPSARRQGSPSYYVAPPSGSTPSTSADRKSRPRRAVERAPLATAAAVAVLPKETMKASSPETPLDFAAAAAGSGASSSGDSRPPSKRRADDGALGSGSGAASSGDEGCSSPGKRPRVDDDGEKAISTRDDVKFAFDLNMPCPEDQEEFPGFC